MALLELGQRKYSIPVGEVVLGSDAGCAISLTGAGVLPRHALLLGQAGGDVVVSGKDVSRRHAEIVQTPRGYLLVDSSTNGTFVNETRVEGQRILQRADVIRIGDEQFRFYADVVPAPPVPSAPAGPPPGPAASAPQAPPQAPPGASERLRDTMHGLEPVPRPSQAGSLASLLVKSGTLKGQRLQVRT